MLSARYDRFSPTNACKETLLEDHDFRRAEAAIEIGEQLLHVDMPGGVAGVGLRADLLRQRREIVDRARRQRHLDAFGGKHPGQRRAQAGARAHDQRGVELHIGHERLLRWATSALMGHKRIAAGPAVSTQYLASRSCGQLWRIDARSVL